MFVGSYTNLIVQHFSTYIIIIIQPTFISKFVGNLGDKFFFTLYLRISSFHIIYNVFDI